MIPLMVDFTNRRVTICGGGEVGARKARYFVQEADVCVYSRTFCNDFQKIPVKKHELELSANENLLDTIIPGSFLVIAATSDSSLNTAILAYCKKQAIHCNNATVPSGDIILPAKYTGDKFTIAVSTTGGSPAISRFVREHLQTTFPNLDRMITLEMHIRAELKDLKIPENLRKKILTAILHDEDIWQELTCGVSAAHQMVTLRYLT